MNLEFINFSIRQAPNLSAHSIFLRVVSSRSGSCFSSRSASSRHMLGSERDGRPDLHYSASPQSVSSLHLSSRSFVPLGLMLLFAVGVEPPHAGVGKGRQA